jgi:hypothetical protein
MWARLNISIAVAKGMVIVGVSVLAYQWASFLHHLAESHYYLSPHLAYYDALIATGALTACIAVMLLSAHNAQRVSKNTLIILGCLMVGTLFGDPQCRGSYDHGGGETEQGWLTFGIIGALIGWMLVTLRSTLTPRRCIEASGEGGPQRRMRSGTDGGSQ